MQTHLLIEKNDSPQRFFRMARSQNIPKKQRNKLASYKWENLVETDVEGIASVVQDRLMAGVVHRKLQALAQTGNDFITRALGT